MSFDYSKLRGRIVEKFGTQAAFCEKLNKSRVSMYNKLNGESGFSQEDIEEWAALLDIDKADYGVYFFNIKV